MPDLLIELFSEEIPARMQRKASDDLRRLMTDGLVEAGLTYAQASAFATPRRLALAVTGLTSESPTLTEERKGPRADAREKAVEGFLRSTGLAREELELRDTPKGQVYFATVTKPGRRAPEIVAEVLQATIRDFPWPKSMRWGAASTEAGALRWVRPLHRIVAVLSDEAGAEVVPVEIGGLKAGDETLGHRFMAPAPIRVSTPDDYQERLQRAHVILSPDHRAERIRHDAEQAAFAQGLDLVDDPGLLAEVAGLVEWPVVLTGRIDDAFLELPPEVLTTSMKEHQKFFSLAEKPGAAPDGQGAPARVVGFVTVANRETADDGATILAGNRKVLNARLADAAFFWQNDLAEATSGMAGWRKALDAMTFHAKLGSQGDRISRIRDLAREIAPSVGADAETAARAAELAKLDLASEMVYEFPELQGVMGRYYTSAAGEDAAVAAAAEAHYAPLGPSDAVPSAPVSVAVALADKLDMLTGFWAIDEKPTGSKDPFALRRAALGVIRLLLENGLRLRLLDLFADRLLRQANQVSGMHHELRGMADSRWASRSELFEMLPWLQGAPFNFVLDHDGLLRQWLSKFGAASILDPSPEDENLWNELDARLREIGHSEPDEHSTPNLIAAVQLCAADLLGFLHDRLKVVMRDRGIRHDVIDAVTAMPGNDDLTLLVKRAEALQEVLATEDGRNLVQGFKRANNILTQAEAADGVEYSFGPQARLADCEEETALFAALDAAKARIDPALQREAFGEAMAAMAELRAPIDAFFEAVQINTDNQMVRRNRLNLLSRIRDICRSVADLTRLEG